MSDAVLIIGGGIGGLSLAQGLKQNDIPSRVFEKDDAASFRAQGYRIRLNQHGIDSLQKLLPPDLFSLLGNACSEVISGGETHNAVTGEVQKGGGGPPPQPGIAWNADRTVLRNVLLKGLEGHVEFGKKMIRYELDGTRATVHFSDGSHASGRLIVGADGVGSHVRKQLSPDQIILDTETRAVFGKTPIGSGIPSPIWDNIDKGITLILDTSAKAHVMLFCDTMKFRHGTDIAVDVPEDYIYWVLCFSRGRVDMSDQELMSLTSVQSAQLAEELCKGWHESNRAIITNQDTEAASTLFFIIGRPAVKCWSSDARVTLLGDAAHPMPPAGGVGANSALEDAVQLLEVLKSPIDKTSIESYEKILLDRARDRLDQSARGLSKLLGMKPLAELKPMTFRAAGVRVTV